MSLRRVLVVALLVWVGLASGQQFRILRPLAGESNSLVWAVSARGDVIFATSGATGFWTDFTNPPTVLERPDGWLFDRPFFLSDDGQTLAGNLRDNGIQRDPFRAVRGQPLTLLGQLTATRNGAVGGISSDGLAITGSSGVLGFLWTGQLASLGISGANISAGGFGITADGTRVVGVKQDTNVGFVTRAFRWDGGTVTFLPGLPGWLDDRSTAVAISGNGRVIFGSQYHRTLGRSKLVRWVNNVPEEIIEGIWSEDSVRTNFDGSVTIWYQGVGFGSRVLSPRGLLPIADYANAIGLADALAEWHSVSVTDVSDDGLTIVGFGYYIPDGDFRGFVLRERGPRIQSFVIDPSTVVGGNGTTGTLTLDRPAGPIGTRVRIRASQAGLTFPAEILIPANASTGSFFIATPSVSEVQQVTFTAEADGVEETATLRLEPLRVVSASVAPTEVAGGNPATLTVEMNGPAPSDAVVTLSSNRTSAAVPATVTVPRGDSSAEVAVTTSAVSSAVVARLTATFGTSSAGTDLTVQPPTFVDLLATPAALTGGAGFQLRLRLSGPAPAGGLTWTLSSSSPSATVPASLTVPGGATEATVNGTTLPVVADLTATLTATRDNLPRTTTLRVLSPRLLGLVLSPSATVGGNRLRGTVSLTGDAAGAGVVVGLTSNQLAAPVPASVRVPAGSRNAIFDIVSAPVGARTVATITARLEGGAQARPLTLEPVDYAIAMTPTRGIGGTRFTARVTMTRPAPLSGVRLAVVSTSPALVVPTTVTVAPGTSVATFAVTSRAVAADTVAQVRVRLGVRVRAASVTVLAPSLVGLTLTPSTVVGGGVVVGRVSLSGPAPAGGVTISLVTNNPTLARIPARITIPAGSASGSFSFRTTKPGIRTNVRIVATCGAEVAAATLAVLP